MTAVTAQNVTKEYTLGQVRGLKHTFLAALRRLAGNSPPPTTATFKALDDVSFTLEQGEVLGIIGENGAGKSTLLKILSGVTTPTGGALQINGSIAPLIEVGAGFHPELTGRENIFLNGTILGLTKRDLREKFDDIVSFAELEEFIDTPIKRYSSGMAIRLGFAVAINVDPEILIIDEVLAVGDLAFQRKCFDRMERLITDKRKTVIIVSHNIRQVERICSRVLLLENGKIVQDGIPAKVCSDYFKLSNQKISAYLHAQNADNALIETTGEVEVVEICVLDSSGNETDAIETGDCLHIRVHLKCNKPFKQPEIVIGTHTTDFVYLNASSTAAFPNRPDFNKGHHSIDCIVPSYPLVAGVYCIRVAFFDWNRRHIFIGENLKLFGVRQTRNEAYEAPVRILNTPTEWKIDDMPISDTSFMDKTNY